jgi:hypothetical protein
MLETLKSTLKGLFNFWKSFIVALQSVTGRAYRIFYIAKLGACDATAGGRVV